EVRPIDTTHNARGRRVCDLGLKARDLLASRSRAVRVDADRNLVRHRFLGVLDTRSDELDALLCARILNAVLTTGPRNVHCRLLPRVLRGREDIARADVQS